MSDRHIWVALVRGLRRLANDIESAVAIEPVICNEPIAPPMRPEFPLSERQERILELIIETIRETGLPPTVRELSVLTGIRSNNAIHGHLIALETKGFIQRDMATARGIRVVATLDKETKETA